MKIELTALFIPVEDGGYVAWTEEYPGANTQGDTLEEARSNLEDAVQLLIDVNRELARESAEGLPPAIRERITIDVPDST